MYDPLAKARPNDPDLVSEDFVINEQRRAYALGYVADRVSKWKEQVEGLQWAAVAQCADQLPLLNLADSNNGLSAQLLRVSDELKARGYPLINSVVEEYGHLGKGLEK